MTKFGAYGAVVKIGNENLHQITAIAVSAGTVYTYTSTAHGFTNGQLISVFGVSPAAYNVQHVAAAGVTANTFNLAVGSNPTAMETTGFAQRDDTFATIVNVSNITGPNMVLNTIDVTTHDSPGAMRESIASFIDGGDVTLELVFDPDAATHLAIIADLQARRYRRNFRIIFPDLTATQWDIPGIVTAFSVGLPVDGAMTASVTITAAGALTLA